MGTLQFMTRKDVAFKIRIDEELRRAFVEACQSEDRPAAQVLREFMRNFVAQREETGPIERIVMHKETRSGTSTKRNKRDKNAR